MYILMICSIEKRSDVTLLYCTTTYGGVASITQPRQLGTTNILMHAPLSGMF